MSTKFKIGDKVFAKLKGYSAWPAIITEDQGTKYTVKFYGTGEIGVVKPKDVFYYLKSKSTQMKSLKRKGYSDAIEEIETAIRECGSDGNTTLDDSSIAAVLQTSKATETSIDNSQKGVKRKRSNSGSLIKPTTAQNVQTKKRLTDNSFEEIQEDANANVEHQTARSDSDETSSKNSTTSKQTKTAESDSGDKEVSITSANIKVITEEYLNNIIAYAEHVRKNAEIYKKKPVEQRFHSDREFVIAKLSSGKYVGIRYHLNHQSSFKSEYEQAEFDESEAKTMLSLKARLEEGSCNAEDDPKLFVVGLELGEELLKNIIEQDLIERKKVILNWLRTEAKMIDLDLKVKSCLGLDKAEPKAAVVHLNDILKLDIKPLMLKKNPHVVDVVSRLRRYIGNITEWNMNENEQLQFEQEAEKVRTVAEKIHIKFATLFNVEEHQFLDTFNNIVEDFNSQAQNLNSYQKSALISEPNTRAAFLEGLEQEDDTKAILIQNVKLQKPEKENSSQIANTEVANVENETENAQNRPISLP